MNLLIVYILTLLVGQSISVCVGLLLDSYHSSYVGLMAFITCYFLMFWLAWRFAIRITEPRAPQQQR